MIHEVNVDNKILTWAIQRAGYDVNVFVQQFPIIQEWLKGDKKPTFRQLEVFAKKVYLPLGYLFLPQPPQEKLPIPFFRTNDNLTERININVYDTILILQQRQDWLRNYLIENNFQKLTFVGKYHDSNDIKAIAADIRHTLQLPENWANEYKKWEDALEALIIKIEGTGIITSFSSYVGNNTHRLIPIDECRGFVLVDEYAPFLFVNSADFKSAQMFTLAHELAHIWTGNSAGFDFRKLQPANNPMEILCDKVAAEFLVPELVFNKVWEKRPNDFSYLSRYFKVSEIVIARRALDTEKISKQQFFYFYEQYANREFAKKEKPDSSGDFYNTAKKRISIAFATHVHNAVKSGYLLYRDAYKLTGLRGDTFENFFSKIS